MYTVNDYVKYYMNISFNKIAWNDMDALLLSLLTYLPYTNINNVSIKDINNYLDDIKGFMSDTSKKLLDKICESKRYKRLVIERSKYIKNKEIQFKAVTYLLNNKRIVAFMGTDGSVVGWKENFNISYMYPTKTQSEAIKYVKEEKDINYIIGHSKGGNLAIISALELGNIEKVYNFDGPGLRNEEYNSIKYNNIKNKIITFLPKESMVGVLMNNDNYYVVNAYGEGYVEHFLPNWYCFGTFLEQSKLSDMSEKIHEGTIKALYGFKQSDVKIIVEEVFNLINKHNIEEWKDVKNIDFNEFINVINNIENVDDSIKKYYINMFKMLVNK